MQSGVIEDTELESVSEHLSPGKKKIAGTLGLLAAFLTFLLPLKFGTITGIYEAPSVLPMGLMKLLIMFWPPMYFSLFSSILLIAVLIVLPVPSLRKRKNILIPLSWFFLFISAFPGFINASTLDVPIIQTTQLAGLASYAIALYALFEYRPETKVWVLNAVVISTVLAAFMGLDQYLYGFKNTIDYIHKVEAENGGRLSAGMLDRLMQTRVFSPFVICNSLAAHLILTLPVCVWGIMRSRVIMKSAFTTMILSVILYCVLPVKSAVMMPLLLFFVLLILVLYYYYFPESEGRLFFFRLVTLLPVSALILFILRHTYSRGAFISFGISLIIVTFFLPLRKAHKAAFTAVILFLAGGLLFSDIVSRTLASMQVRFDYYQRALDIYASNPVAGTGWGDFLYDYMRIKQFPGAESPHTPHNAVLSFLSQAGIIGGAAAVILFTVPFFLVFNRLKNRMETEWYTLAVLCGWTAWSIHSMIDFNIQIAGTAATALAIVTALGGEREFADGERRMRGKLKFFLYYPAALLVAVTAFTASVHQIRIEAAFKRFQNVCIVTNSASGRKHEPPQFVNKILLRTVAEAPYSSVPWITAAVYSRNISRWHDMECYTMEALKRAPESPNLYAMLAQSQFESGKKTEALKSLKKAADRFPNKYLKAYRNAENAVFGPR